MWLAQIIAIAENSVPNDTVNINVQFTEEKSGKTFTKGYNLSASNIKSIEDVKSIIATDVKTLAQFDDVKIIIEANLNIPL